MARQLKLKTRMGIGFAVGAIVNIAVLSAALFGLSLTTSTFFFFYFSGVFLLLGACFAYLAGSFVGHRLESENYGMSREMRDQFKVVQELMKANEYLETETLDLKKHRKALLSIMEDAERFNEELKHEITERKQAQSEAARARENMELILHGGDLGYWDWDIPGKNIVCNERFSIILGHSPDQQNTGEEWRKEHIHPDDFEMVSQALASHFNEKNNLYTCEYRIRHNSGSWIWVLDRGKIIEWNQDRTPLRMAGTLLDITKRKEHELEMREANRKLDKHTRELEEGHHIIMGMMEDANDARDSLEKANRQLLAANERSKQANQAKSDFLASMSHEIRTPMNGIIGTASLLGDTSINSEQKEYLRIIQTSGDALLTLLNDILDFSKIEAGRLDLELHAFDLRETCEHITELLTPTALEKGIDLILRYSPNTPAWVVGDAGRIRQVLMNLTHNALKFTREGYVYINIEAVAGTDEETTIHFDVKDTGIGIDPKDQQQLFRKFSQGDTSSTREYGGTGLGLAICKQLVSLMGGKIGMASKPGEGASFWFRLHLPIAKRPIPAVIDRAIFKKEKVLVIEEKKIMGKILVEWLNRWGMQADTSQSIDKAIEKLRANDYRIVLVEEHLAYSSGIPFFNTPEFENITLFVICSITNRDYRSLDRAGLASNLIKPIRLGNLLAKTARALGYPLENEQSTNTPPLVDTSTIASIGTRHILVTEDNLVNQTVVKRMLVKGGFDVDVAENGEQALKKITSGKRYDLVFMDCQMPRMDGYEAARNIREFEENSREGARIPIIALTANAMQDDREKCLNAGMDDYIPKPVKQEALFEMIHRHLG